MAESNRSTMPMPTLVIDSCSSDDEQHEKQSKNETVKKIRRSWSLTNYQQAYKDLHGAIHASLTSQSLYLHGRSRSYPNNYLSFYMKTNDKNFLLQSPTASIHMNMNSLDPNGGAQTPGGSSSRYSLYGSFFDLSESGYYPATDQIYSKSDNKLLTAGGRPLLILDQRTRLSANTIQDKCNDWLSQLNTNPT